MEAARTTVLVVEDDAALRRVLELRLSIEGFRVVTAADGAEGVERLDSRPDVVLTDLMMPRLGGDGLCRHIRSRDDDLARLPILILTARERGPDIDALLALGGIAYMGKPFDAAALASSLRELAAAPATPAG